MTDNKKNTALWTNAKINLLALLDVEMMVLLKQSWNFPMLPNCTNVVSTATTDRIVSDCNFTYKILKLDYLFVWRLLKHHTALENREERIL